MEKPIYDIEKTYLENYAEGPFFKGEILERVISPEEEWHDFLGFKIASRLGVPAGPLLNSRWVDFAAQMGFDVLTYKTIRSHAHPAHPLPNMIYVRAEEKVAVQTDAPDSIEELAATNSFGMPSRSPDQVVADIAHARKVLKRGQVLIVSVVGSGEKLADDFASAAHLALEGGAEIIEANFSCPNVASGEGSLYQDPESVYALARQLKQAVGAVPLILKLGLLPNPTQLRSVMQSAARAGVQGLCAINTISMPVVDENGLPALGPNRKTAGICGNPIREATLDFLRQADAINREEKLGLTLIGTGGVTLPEHFDLFFEAGADIAMSAVGMMWDPQLAIKHHQEVVCV